VQNLPDEELTRRIAAGHHELFRILVDRYKQALYRFACSVLRNPADAEDAAQETFWRAWRAIGTFESGSPASGWLYKIALNVCRDCLRRRRTRAEMVKNAAYERSSTTASAGNDGRLSAEFERALDGLDDKYRIPFLLLHRQHKSYDEIAQLTGVPLNTVRTHIKRARERLLRILTSSHLFEEQL